MLTLLTLAPCFRAVLFTPVLAADIALLLLLVQVAESKFLNNKLVEVVAFMENIALKDSTEKDMFFKKLPVMIPAIPEPVAIRKILPQLSNALEYGGAPATAVSSLLMIGRYVRDSSAISIPKGKWQVFECQEQPYVLTSKVADVKC